MQGVTSAIARLSACHSIYSCVEKFLKHSPETWPVCVCVFMEIRRKDVGGYRSSVSPMFV